MPAIVRKREVVSLGTAMSQGLGSSQWRCSGIGLALQFVCHRLCLTRSPKP